MFAIFSYGTLFYGILYNFYVDIEKLDVSNFNSKWIFMIYTLEFGVWEFFWNLSYFILKFLSYKQIWLLKRHMLHWKKWCALDEQHSRRKIVFEIIDFGLDYRNTVVRSLYWTWMPNVDLDEYVLPYMSSPYLFNFLLFPTKIENGLKMIS